MTQGGASMVEVIGSPALRAESFARRDGRLASRDLIEGEIGAMLTALPSAAWAHRFGRAGIACARVMRDEEVMTRRDFWADGILRALPTPSGELVAGGAPWRLPPETPTPTAPHPGEHTDLARAQSERFWLTESRPDEAPGDNPRR